MDFDSSFKTDSSDFSQQHFCSATREELPFALRDDPVLKYLSFANDLPISENSKPYSDEVLKPSSKQFIRKRGKVVPEKKKKVKKFHHSTKVVDNSGEIANIFKLNVPRNHVTKCVKEMIREKSCVNKQMLAFMSMRVVNDSNFRDYSNCIETLNNDLKSMVP